MSTNLLKAYEEINKIIDKYNVRIELGTNIIGNLCIYLTDNKDSLAIPRMNPVIDETTINTIKKYY